MNNPMSTKAATPSITFKDDKYYYLKSYAFEVGEIKQLPGKVEHKIIVQGTTQEISFVDAYRKVTGDHATILCRGDTYCKIESPVGGSVTIITKKVEK